MLSLYIVFVKAKTGAELHTRMLTTRGTRTGPREPVPKESITRYVHVRLSGTGKGSQHARTYSLGTVFLGALLTKRTRANS